MKNLFLLFLTLLSVNFLNTTLLAQTHLKILKDLPGKPRFRAFSFLYNEFLYVGGGRNYPDPPAAINELWAYDIKNDEWIDKGKLPFGQRSNISCFIFNDKAYTGLGYDGGGSSLSNIKSDFWEYDIPNNKWNRKNDFPGPKRYFPSMVSSPTKGYLFGGSAIFGTQAGTNFNDLWEYDPILDSWKKLADLPSFGRYSPFMVYYSNNIYLGLGYLSNGTVFYSDIWRYDIILNEWHNMPKLSSTSLVSEIEGGASFATIYKDKLWVSNIEVSGNSIEDFFFMECFSFSDSSWTVFENVNPLGYNSAPAIGYKDSKCWMMGGYDTVVHNHTYEFDFGSLISKVEDVNKSLLDINVFQNTSNSIQIHLPESLLISSDSYSFHLLDLLGKELSNVEIFKSNSIVKLNSINSVFVWQIKKNNRLLKSGQLLCK